MLGIIRSYSIVWWSRPLMIHSMSVCMIGMFCGVSIVNKQPKEEGGRKDEYRNAV